MGSSGNVLSVRCHISSLSILASDEKEELSALELEVLS